MTHAEEIKLIIGDVYDSSKFFIDGIDMSKAIVSIDYKYKSYDGEHREHSITVTYFDNDIVGKPCKRTIGLANIY